MISTGQELFKKNIFSLQKELGEFSKVQNGICDQSVKRRNRKQSGDSQGIWSREEFCLGRGHLCDLLITYQMLCSLNTDLPTIKHCAGPGSIPGFLLQHSKIKLEISWNYINVERRLYNQKNVLD